MFVVPPFARHIRPTVGVAGELATRGHDVAWVGEADALATVLPGWARVHGCAAAPVRPRPDRLGGSDAVQHLWERVLVPITETMVSGVENAVLAERPDVLVADQQAFAGALVAERMGIPWATSAASSAELTGPRGYSPQVRDWVRGHLDALRARFGDAARTGDVRFSPYLVLAFTSPALAGDRVASDVVQFVGPVRRERTGPTDFPWQSIDGEHPLVYITLGAVGGAASERFLAECVRALRARPRMRAVIADPAGALGEVPGNVVVRDRVPQRELLDHADVVLCHGGHGTVCEALSRGLPLVVAPVRDCQPIVAEQVEQVGVGTRLRLTHARAEHIGDAIDATLTDPSYRRAAGEVAMSFLGSGGERAAADRLELVSRTHPSPNLPGGRDPSPL
nr:nucleotide disphospho-sugar-binding domain-containing protein [Haloechinothrix aidingensis]